MGVCVRATLSVALLLVLMAPVLNAQAPYEPVRPEPASESWRWRVFPALAALDVRVVHPSTTGSVWVGAAGGVYQFDGVEAHRMDGPGAPDRPVEHLLQTHDGQLLAATEGGIHRWDGSSWHREGPQGEPPGFFVRGLAQDVAGGLWAATGWGLLRLGPAPQLYTRQDTLSTLSRMVPELNPRALPAGILSGIPTPQESEGASVGPELLGAHATADGRLWLVRPRGVLLRFNPATIPSTLPLGPASAERTAWTWRGGRGSVAHRMVPSGPCPEVASGA